MAQFRRILSKITLLILFWVFIAVMYRYLRATLALTFICWVFASMLIFVSIARLQSLKHKIVQFYIAVIVLGPLWISAIVLHQLDRTMLFYLIMLVCFADTGAYFVGSRYGRTKLLPSVSPKKSVEGLVGGLIVGSVAGLGVMLFFPHLTVLKTILWLIFGLFLIIMSVVGDLFESLMKRLNDTKDSGMLLPGHGGMLDRVDSLAASFPIYLFFLLISHTLSHT